MISAFQQLSAVAPKPTKPKRVFHLDEEATAMNLLGMMRDEKVHTSASLRKVTGQPPSTVNMALRRLQDHGFIKKVGEEAYRNFTRFFYRITPAGLQALPSHLTDKRNCE